MITKKHLKIFLSFLSLVVLLLGGCKVRNKLGSETQDSQISGEIVINTDIPSWSTNISSTYEGSQISYEKTNDINTNFPSWSTNVASIPEEYWGKYQYLDGNGYQGIAAVTRKGKDITLYYKNDDGNLQVTAYFYVFDKKAEYKGNNTWQWLPFYWGNSGVHYINKNDVGLSPDTEIITFERNEKGQRILKTYVQGKKFNTVYVHSEDINK
ncbi:hypothetical protein [Brachyspira sp.]|uniref:hypothetical protein n=1 Tax=Brachyspira sp. TaxID=1977261 RepID=UPI003D7DFBC9